MNRKQRREIAKEISLRNLMQNMKDNTDHTLRIGRRDLDTGKSEVIFPNGGTEFSGIKLFNSSPAYGTPVCSTLLGNKYTLDQLSFEEIIFQSVEEKQIEIVDQLQDTYIIFYIDTSGSMGSQIPAIESMIANLKSNLQEKLYGNDPELTNQYVRVVYESNEQWLQWFNYDARKYKPEPDDNLNLQLIDDPDLSEGTDKHIIISFINESDPVYSDNDGIQNPIYSIPTGEYIADYNSFINSFESNDSGRSRDFFKGVVISVNYSDNPVENDFVKNFSLFLVTCINGLANYSSLYLLKDFGITFRIDVSAEQTEETYLDLIYEYLEIEPNI